MFRALILVARQLFLVVFVDVRLDVEEIFMRNPSQMRSIKVTFKKIKNRKCLSFDLESCLCSRISSYEMDNVMPSPFPRLNFLTS